MITFGAADHSSISFRVYQTGVYESPNHFLFRMDSQTYIGNDTHYVEFPFLDSSDTRRWKPLATVGDTSYVVDLLADPAEKVRLDRLREFV